MIKIFTKDEFDYRKLRGKIREHFTNQEELAKILGVSNTSLSKKLNNHTSFSQDEVYHLSLILGIEMKEVATYFFTPKVQKLEQQEQNEKEGMGA